MSFDREAVEAAITTHGRIARVVVAETHGSAPREVGASMLIWNGGQSGTIGGGALEWEAAARARAALAGGDDRIDRVALGPGVGQCCGGAVSLLTEVWDVARLADAHGPLISRPVPGGNAEPSLRVRRLLQTAREAGERPAPVLLDGWMIEAVSVPARQIWVWGAGHVGRAIVGALLPLPDFSITWVDTAEDRFPEVCPDGVTQLVARDPALVASHAPPDAGHLILTYSHALDLAICSALLSRGFADCGLIGSATKWARFQRRLSDLGHSAEQIARIRCPIGEPALGKHPQAIAIGVAREALTQGAVAGAALGRTAAE